MPALTSLPTVVTLLDLAPWELPERFGRRVLGGLGHRLRTRLLRRAAAVIVASEATAASARALLGIRRARLHVIPLAPRPAFAGTPPDRSGPTIDPRTERERLGLPGRYFVYSGRYDARQDLATLLMALARLAAAGRPTGLPEGESWPPRVLLVGASPDDRAALARAAARHGVGDSISYAPRLEAPRLAALVREARAAVLPVLVESAGLAAIEAIACGTPVIASEVGVLPEVIGSAGLVVPPRDPERLAVALSTAWVDDTVRDAVAVAARKAATSRSWTWSDVARATRGVYQAAVGRQP
jgi:glycosyltransferase involved in cell wall biosynthesis